MTSLSKLVSFLSALLTLSTTPINCSSTSSCKTEQVCNWAMDVLEMTSENKLRMKNDVISPEGSYFLRIQVSFQNKICPSSLRSLVYSGYTPSVNLEVTRYGLDEIRTTKKRLYTEGVFVQFKHSSMSDNQARNYLTLETNISDPSSVQNNCKVKQVNDEETLSQDLSMNMTDFPLSDVAWLVPLSIDDDTEFTRCSITNPDVIGEYSHIVHSSGLMKFLESISITPNGGSFGNSDIIMLNQPFSINRLEIPTPFLVIATADSHGYCVVTHSEFETSTFIKIRNISQNGLFAKVCPDICFPDAVKESVSLPDRILLATCFGLQEIRQTSTRNGHAKIVLPECVVKIVYPTQAVPKSVQILVITESSLVYKSSLHQHDESLLFTQLKDSENLTLCEFLGLGGELNQVISSCIFQDATINSVPKNHYVFLIIVEISSNTRQYIISYTDNKWKIVFAIPLSLPKPNQDGNEHVDQHWMVVTSVISGPIPVHLTGLSFTKTDNDVIFIWGNVLMYSPNRGQDVFWLSDFPAESSRNISVFTSASDGFFAFLTTSRQVWWGQTSTGRVHMLEVAGQWNVGLSMNQELAPSCPHDYSILSLFFDTSGQLWKVLQCHNSSSSSQQQQPCLQRSKVMVSDLLSHSHLIHEQTSLENTTSPAHENFILHVPRHCIQFTVTVKSSHDNYYTRHVIKMVDIPYLVNSVPASTNMLTEYLGNLRLASRDQTTMAVNQSNFELPTYVYLQNEESFGFEVTMSLETREGGSSYVSLMEQLRLSYQVSDATLLHVTVERTTFTHNATVHYKFTLTDSGLVLKKNAPGIGLHPVHLRIQPWQGDETCLAKNPETNLLKGSQVVTVLLGCPPGIKVLFDPLASINVSMRSQFCDNRHGIPCFLFENTFHPVFNLLDESTGNVTLFTGKYQLRIKGGGKDVGSITDYNQDDIILYNYKNLGSPSTLIWTPKDKILDSIPSFNISTNGLQWLCGRKSPCAEISPTFPDSPEFYFKLEFSNRDIQDDISNCDLTTDFIIRIHGIPLGSLYPATVIVMTCIGIITCYVFTMYAFKRNNQHLWNIVCNMFVTKRDQVIKWARKRLARSEVNTMNQVQDSVHEYPVHNKKDV